MRNRRSSDTVAKKKKFAKKKNRRLWDEEEEEYDFEEEEEEEEEEDDDDDEKTLKEILSLVSSLDKKKEKVDTDFAAAAAAGAGLENVGNTCYLNSVLQCIIHTVPLVEKLRSSDGHRHPHFTDDNNDFCSLCALTKLVDSCMAKSETSLVPCEFAGNLGKISSDFLLGQQEDAHEFLLCLLDNLSNCCPDKNNLVKDVYGGTCISQLRCCECGHCSDTPEPMFGLSLEIAGAQTLTDALESYTKAEKIEDTMFTCSGCDSRVLMEKQNKIDHAPPVVYLHLKRFTNDGKLISKIDKFVAYPLELDLRPFISCPRDEEQTMYELYAVLVHQGMTPSRGHYYSFVRSNPTTWHLMNDSYVDRVQEIHALLQTAYILFYVKKGSSPTFSSLMEVTQNNKDASPTSVLDRSGYRVTPEIEEDPDSCPDIFAEVSVGTKSDKEDLCRSSSRVASEKEEPAGPCPDASPKCATDHPCLHVNEETEGDNNLVKCLCESLTGSLEGKPSSPGSAFQAFPHPEDNKFGSKRSPLTSGTHPPNKKRQAILLDTYPSDVLRVREVARDPQ